MEVRRVGLANWALRTLLKFTTGLNISSIRDFEQIRDLEIPNTLRPLLNIIGAYTHAICIHYVLERKAYVKNLQIFKR